MSVAVSEYHPTAEDLRLERELARIYVQATTTSNRTLARFLWRDYAEAKRKRSAEMIAHLERLQGLRPPQHTGDC